jgi:hypothetical protein
VAQAKVLQQSLQALLSQPLALQLPKALVFLLAFFLELRRNKVGL